MVIALGLTLGAMLSPGWQQLKQTDGKDIHVGILFCRDPSNEHPVNSSGKDYCTLWWDNQPTTMKAVIACMCIAVVVEAIAIVWTLFTICACCCKKYLVHPLPALAIVGSLLLAIAIGIYGANHKEMIGPPNDFSHSKEGTITYSFYLACGALAACIADIIVGALTVTLAQHCL
uniref:Claudin-9-like n=1 Tax=Steinernema glaseri TaxID=37863 RepID=A0A1I8ADC4_9BILA